MYLIYKSKQDLALNNSQCFVWHKKKHKPTNIAQLAEAVEQSDEEVPVMLGRWGMRNTLSLPLLPGLLWPGVVTPDSVLSKG